MARTVDVQVTKLAWVATIADITAPKVATELNAVGTLDLTCQMSTTYNVGFEGSNTVNERAVCEGAEATAPSTKKYGGTLVLFRDYAAGVATATDPLETFEGNFEQGYFVRRTGKPYSDAFIVGDVVEIYKFIADVPQTPAGTDSGFLKATIPLLPMGVATLKGVAVA